MLNDQKGGQRERYLVKLKSAFCIVCKTVEMAGTFRD